MSEARLVPSCCHVGCEEAATHRIIARGPLVDEGDYVDACAKHVGLLLGCSDGTGPATHWEVLEIGTKPLVCPDCGEVLVKTHYQDADEGHWFVCWMCECKPDMDVVNDLDREGVATIDPL